MPDIDALADCRKVRSDRNVTWYLLGRADFGPTDFAALGDPEAPLLPPGGTLLKTGRQRFVARVPLARGGTTAVYKVFPLKNLASRLRAGKFALREFANLREPERRGVPVPAPLAYFEKRRLGLVVANALVSEDLAGWQDLSQGGDAAAAANQAIGPLLRLWQAGCQHADARDENIFLRRMLPNTGSSTGNMPRSIRPGRPGFWNISPPNESARRPCAGVKFRPVSGCSKWRGGPGLSLAVSPPGCSPCSAPNLRCGTGWPSGPQGQRRDPVSPGAFGSRVPAGPRETAPFDGAFSGA